MVREPLAAHPGRARTAPRPGHLTAAADTAAHPPRSIRARGLLPNPCARTGHAGGLLLNGGAPGLRRLLEKGLRANGYDVEWAADGREALRRGVQPDISLVILDLGLPDLDGLDVLEGLRERGCAVPVLVLSARGRPRRVMSRQELLSMAWGMTFDPGTNLVDVYVGYLRRKLGERVIETVRGAGYCLRAEGPASSAE